MEYDPTMSRTPRSKWKGAGVYVPTLKQALSSKLTWDELWGYGLPKIVVGFSEAREHDTKKPGDKKSS